MYIRLWMLFGSLSFFLAVLCCFLAEISVGGSGAWSEKLIGFSFRKLLFVLISLFLILIFLLERKCLSIIFYLSLVSVFLLFEGVLPYLNDYWGAIFKMLRRSLV
ncbi:hypothetical protein [Microbulbifer taiwanensis]|uniref:Lipoprotein n=1 Tax=Microbulbifer taiwanensis TaxID=986746 RepID=A0ABW1YV07_9GAMM